MTIEEMERLLNNEDPLASIDNMCRRSIESIGAVYGQLPPNDEDCNRIKVRR